MGRQYYAMDSVRKEISSGQGIYVPGARDREAADTKFLVDIVPS